MFEDCRACRVYFHDATRSNLTSRIPLVTSCIQHSFRSLVIAMALDVWWHFFLFASSLLSTTCCYTEAMSAAFESNLRLGVAALLSGQTLQS